MSCFFRLIEQFHTQAEPAYCGLGRGAKNDQEVTDNVHTLKYKFDLTQQHTTSCGIMISQAPAYFYREYSNMNVINNPGG